MKNEKARKEGDITSLRASPVSMQLRLPRSPSSGVRAGEVPADTAVVWLPPLGLTHGARGR